MASKNGGRSNRPTFTDQEALLFHSQRRPGKLEVVATKPMATQRDLSLAYSPGVAVPVLAIAEDESRAYDYTTKGNFVAVITNGTAILGLGNRGALAAKPVMEGKSVLFKRFADVDSIDLEVSTEDTDAFVDCVKLLGKSWGGINLEDIKAPECFIIEQRLRELLDIPVFHDDQHGTAIIAAAGLINAIELTGREIKNTKVVCNGAGAAGIACLELLRAIGFRPENLILCDTKGVIYEGRRDGMNQWKSGFAVKTKARTLAEALEGADVFFGLSVKGAVTQDMVKSMAEKPIIFAMANPDPEITVEEVAAVRSDAIMATGRAGAGQARARGRARRSRRRLWGTAEIWPRLHHPGAVRSAAHLVHSTGGGAGRDGYESRPAADCRHGCLPASTAQPARSDRRRFAASV